ncbi:MAG: TIM barrel protein [Nanoarchaeota archaeon]|nr:TIM barrel protein [Nanoarchaeota archaeon]
MKSKLLDFATKYVQKGLETAEDLFQTISGTNPDTLDILVTFPDNPNSKTGKLFPGNYLIEFNGGIDKKIKEFNGLLGGIEVHFQTFDELALEGPEYKKIQDYVNKLKEKGVKLMMHAPFVEDRNPKDSKPLNMNFKWFVVPEEYRKQEDGNQKPVVQTPDGKITIYAEETKQEEMKKTIQLADKLGIELLTVHVTKPGTILKGADWNEYKEYIKNLTNYINKKDFKVKLCVETGGALEEQLVELHETYGTNINLDTAHYVLDLTSKDGGLNLREANKKAIAFFKKHSKYIGQVHLTQTAEKADLHKGIYETGALTCNEEIIRLISKEQKKGRSKLCMIESRADIENFYQVAKALRSNNEYEEKFLVAGLGLPVSGKTVSLNMIKEVFGVPETLESDRIRETYDTAFSFTEVVPEINKEMVYDDMHQQAENKLKHGVGVILDATYHLKERREQINEIINSHCVKDVYIMQLECDDDATKERLNERKKENEELTLQGKTAPKKLSDFEIFKDLRSKAEPMKLDEFKNAHILIYNTSRGVVDVYNKDFTSEVMVMKLRNDVEKQFNQELKINYR